MGGLILWRAQDGPLCEKVWLEAAAGYCFKRMTKLDAGDR